MLLQTEELTKDYGRRRALDRVSFVVAAGEVFGIVGPNGAGKSTLFDIIAGAALPSSGTVSVEGQRIDGQSAHASRQAADHARRDRSQR